MRENEGGAEVPKKGRGRGRGRGKGTGRGKGRGRGKEKAKGKGKGTPKAKPTKTTSPKLKRGKTKQAKGKGLSPKFDKAAKDDTWSAKEGDGSLWEKLEGEEEIKRKKEPAEAKAAQPKAKAKTEDKKRKGDSQSSAPQAKQERKKRGIEIPTFNHSTVVPYWSRNACALKMPCGDGSGKLTQALLSSQLEFTCFEILQLKVPSCLKY